MDEQQQPPAAPTHPHGAACYWDLFECRWSCELPPREVEAVRTDLDLAASAAAD